jgi:Asp/Glu/hydantoin racemase
MTSGHVRGGFNQYGFTVGVLILDTRFPRVVGDIGNAWTFPFPIRYHRVAGAAPDLVVRRGAEGLLPAFIDGARELEREGVGAITTSCGFLVKLQRQLGEAVRVPVFTSSLLMVPLVARMLPAGRRVGIMTVNASTLSAEHLAGAGIAADTPLAVIGMETEKEFTRVMLDDEAELDVERAREEHVRVARRFVQEHRDLGAIVLECTNMPPYADDIRRETGLPVFDIVSLITMVHGALRAGAGPRPA